MEVVEHDALIADQAGAAIDRGGVCRAFKNCGMSFYTEDLIESLSEC
jgi:hypothetical protein